MKNNYKKSLLLVICLVNLNILNAQLSVTGKLEGLKFLGDVGQKNNTNFFSDMRLGYGLSFEYRFGKVLGISIDGLYGKLAGNDNDKSSHLNFESKVIGTGFNLYAYFDKLDEIEKDVAPYIHAGVGYLTFNPYGDLKNSNGTTYNYWQDGSIRDLPESKQNEPMANIIKRDYSYETQLKDSLSGGYSKSVLYVPLGIGAKFKMGFRANLKIGVVYNLCMGDYIDNFKSGGNDSWASANVAVNIKLGKKPKDPFAPDIDFSSIDNTDMDEDGVKDINDRCLGTPKGIKVDGKGCPDDKDEDGVYDYMDKELSSKKGAKVDGEGITIDEDETAKRQLEWDSLSSERSEGFNNAPSLTYLKEVEAKAKEVQIKTGKVSKVPAELANADINYDGYISASEITKTIDGFFEGENSFNVEKINKLIDFFFEQ